MINPAQNTPNLLTTLGILGTFVGIVIGLIGFDIADINTRSYNRIWCSGWLKSGGVSD